MFLEGDLSEDPLCTRDSASGFPKTILFEEGRSEGVASTRKNREWHKLKQQPIGCCSMEFQWQTIF
jgi:hypothetical protein